MIKHLIKGWINKSKDEVNPIKMINILNKDLCNQLRKKTVKFDKSERVLRERNKMMECKRKIEGDDGVDSKRVKVEETESNRTENVS